MFSKLNIYLSKNFIYSFLIVFILFTMLLFFSDLMEQFRKASNKEVPINIILKLTLLNAPSLSFSTLPVVIFFSTLLCYLKLIRSTEYIIMNSSGISYFQLLKAPILIFFTIGIIFVLIVNPITAVFQKDFQELDYKYIKRMDRLSSISKNGIWLMQENAQGLTNIIYAKNIKDNGSTLIDFMLLEYNDNNKLLGRIDGKKAELVNEKWLMQNLLITKKNESPIFYPYYEYSTYLDKEDIRNSLLAPEMMSFLQLGNFIYILEKLGYSANDHKIYYYNILLLPIVIVGFVILANAIIIGIKQNDRFARAIIISFLMMIIYYFISNLMNTLGSNSKLPPFISASITPIMLLSLALTILKFKALRRKI